VARPVSPLRGTALDLWAAGRTALAIADATGLSLDAVRAIVAGARAADDPRAIHHDPGSPAKWTAERIQRLKALWAEGKSCSKIAALLGDGTTRNAVIGKAHRLKLPARLSPGRVKPRRRRVSGVLIAARLRARRQVRELGSGAHGRRSGKATLPDAAPEVPAPRPQSLPPPDARPVTLVERGNRQCSFVLGEVDGGDTLMCGAPKEFGESYCDHHTEIAYELPAPAWSAERRARFFLARARRLAAEGAPLREQPEPTPAPPTAVPGRGRAA
jgi:GcrA cell cycle regulator